MILVANLVSCASFCGEKFFKIALGTMLLSCRVKTCRANTFIKLSEATTSLQRVLEKSTNFAGKHLCWSLLKTEDLQHYLKETSTRVFFLQNS